MTESRGLDDHQHSSAKTTNVVDLDDAFDALHIDKGKRRERPPALLLATHDSHENSLGGVKEKERARDANREKVIISFF